MFYSSFAFFSEFKIDRLLKYKCNKHKAQLCHAEQHDKPIGTNYHAKNSQIN